ncbi:Smr/MutS family protein [Marivita hallyeonensis]|uniref:DNA-nicking endonuclease, Smr domain n=1 Tax=Marivita hallyeonensis TaxID=996342 RepID=A0A1M5UEX4_9RHOB|nr:Smr/MutS family protein [Marivita hallyeonensis]SHH61448.1 DNA-nicking endonuclease, Smr domain [Marivita hallyeonensis]
MSRRKLRADERELWQKVAHSTKPLPEALHREKAVKTAPTLRQKPEPQPMDLLKAFGVGAKSALPHGQITTPQPTTRSTQNMDKKTFGKMRRGKLVPEARIDLHGMTLDQAHPALTRFIFTSHSRGFRLVLVITGKGRSEDPYDPMPRQRGVLKRQVPMWLKMAPLASVVLEVTEAHLRHGGGGAYYVYLRRTSRT